MRFYSATPVAEPPIPEPESAPLHTRPSPNYTLRSGMILTRAPLLTRKLHPFETSFFFYQKRLEERLNNAFIPSIYYKPDTARRMEWDLKIGERGGRVAKELGTYNGKSTIAWQDELKVGDDTSSEEHLLKSLLKDAEMRVSDDAEVIPKGDVQPVTLPSGRETEADRKGDVKRLDRALDRTLYLVVKGKDGWAFPADAIPVGENVHEVSTATSTGRLVPANTCEDRKEGSRPDRWCQHEHLDGWPRPRRPRGRSTQSQGRWLRRQAGAEDLLRQESHYGWSGRLEGQSLWLH